MLHWVWVYLRVLGSCAGSEDGKGDDGETHFGSDLCRLMICWC